MHGGRPGGRNGDERDAFGAKHTQETWKPGQRRRIRERSNRAHRRDVRAALRTGREV